MQYQVKPEVKNTNDNNNVTYYPYRQTQVIYSSSRRIFGCLNTSSDAAQWKHIYDRPKSVNRIFKGQKSKAKVKSQAAIKSLRM